MKRTMTRRFYKTSSAVNYPALLKTLGEAIEDAKSDVENNKNDEVYIVEVIRVVRRERNPIVVEEIRK